MQARVEDMGDVVVVSLLGFLDFESVDPFRKYCLTQLVNKRVIFNLCELNFVGSSGITTFLETMKQYRVLAPLQPRFCGLSSEFKRLFAMAHLAGLEVFETPELAIYGTSAELIPEWVEQEESIEGDDLIVDEPQIISGMELETSDGLGSSSR